MKTLFFSFWNYSNRERCLVLYEQPKYHNTSRTRKYLGQGLNDYFTYAKKKMNFASVG